MTPQEKKEINQRLEEFIFDMRIYRDAVKDSRSRSLEVKMLLVDWAEKLIILTEEIQKNKLQ